MDLYYSSTRFQLRCVLLTDLRFASNVCVRGSCVITVSFNAGSSVDYLFLHLDGVKILDVELIDGQIRTRNPVPQRSSHNVVLSVTSDGRQYSLNGVVFEEAPVSRITVHLSST